MYLVGIAAVVLGGMISLFAGRRVRAIVAALGVLLGGICAASASVGVLLSGNALSFGVTLPYFIGDAVFTLDALSAFFALIIVVAGTLVSVYAVGYTAAYDRRAHFFFLALLIASMLAVIICSHALAFLVCWEIMSLASFFCILFDTEHEGVLKAAVEYLVAMHIGVLFLTAAFLLAWGISGSPDIQAMKGLAVMRDGVIALFFIGFAFKAGFMPFHTWLPSAHPAAPSHVSALMSGVMVKLGIYGILRTIALAGVPSAWMAWTFAAVALVTAFIGVAYALAQSDVKRLLAYSTVENIGIIGTGIALGMLGITYGNSVMAAAGFSGALLHTVNHSFFKTLLFSATGAVYTRSHTREMDSLGGIARTMPFTAVFFLIGALAIAGMPLFNGFIGEFIIYRSIMAGIPTAYSLVFIIFFALFACVGAIAVIGFTKAFGIIFQGLPRTDAARHAAEVSPVMLIPMGAFALGCITFGVYPKPLLHFITRPLALFTDVDPAGFEAFSPMITVFGIAAGLIIVFSVIRMLLLRGRIKARVKTWDCGFAAPTARMQYTGASFAAPFLAVVRVLSGRAVIRKPQGFFPSHASFCTKRSDVFDRRAIRPFLTAFRRTLDRFSWIQSGSTQQYILFGILFLCIMLVLAVGVRW